MANAESALGKSWGGRRAIKRIRKAHTGSRHTNIKETVDALADQWHATYDALGEIVMGECTDDWAGKRAAECWEVMVDGVSSSIKGHFVRMMQLKGPDVAASNLREQMKNVEHQLQNSAKWQKDDFRRLKVWMETRLAELDASRKD